MNIRRKARPKPWMAKKQGRNRRNAETHELIKPFANNVSSTFYKSSQWKATRESVLNRDPTCVWCIHLARMTPATEADHVIPVHRCEVEGVSPYDFTSMYRDNMVSNARRASYDAKGVHYTTIEGWVDFLRRKLIEKTKL